jgi:hypothetical protein
MGFSIFPLFHLRQSIGDCIVLEKFLQNNRLKIVGKEMWNVKYILTQFLKYSHTLHAV